MKNYLTFEQVISRTKYGTDINIIEAFTNKNLFNKVWRFNDNVEDFGTDILESEVIGFSINDDKQLLVEIVKQ